MQCLFVYGSLMYPEVWKRLIRRNCQRSAARIQGWKRVRLEQRSYPGLIPGEGWVDGFVWHPLEEADWIRLDRFEGEEYERLQVQAILKGDRAEVGAFVYATKISNCSGLTGDPWRPEHFEENHLQKFLQACKGFEEGAD